MFDEARTVYDGDRRKRQITNMTITERRLERIRRMEVRHAIGQAIYAGLKKCWHYKSITERVKPFIKEEVEKVLKPEMNPIVYIHGDDIHVWCNQEEACEYGNPVRVPYRTNYSLSPDASLTWQEYVDKYKYSWDYTDRIAREKKLMENDSKLSRLSNDVGNIQSDAKLRVAKWLSISPDKVDTYEMQCDYPLLFGAPRNPRKYGAL